MEEALHACARQWVVSEVLDGRGTGLCLKCYVRQGLWLKHCMDAQSKAGGGDPEVS